MASSSDESVRERTDRFHTARAAQGGRDSLATRLHAEAFGAEYPEEVDPASSCTWQVLGGMVRGLRLRPGQTLVDLGCGNGGTGLWLARALNARLVGVDISPVAVGIAGERAAAFVPEGRAEFRTGTFLRTGLPDACADGAVSMDALPFTEDRTAALRELRRILRPGARAVFTGNLLLPGHPQHRPDRPRWSDHAAEAGLEWESAEERPEEPALWVRLYDLWEQHQDELRAEVGDAATEAMLEEARIVRPLMDRRTPLVITLRRPVDS
ncbi:class I SAM-dependent methyltransferase [Streptacidiphilus sp. N1-10]|uniref:Class I SAM-dependent methyltransferase n=1 Tax=Streptacidiphilus jeojiensis TaxID=3229225 RepID=A0ABV6XIH8_9ACTN